LSQSELDVLLGTVENPIRRRIIARLSEEPNYQLQLSKELGISQQLVAKHLSTIEGAGLVGSTMEDSPRGPQRREYLLRKSISVTIDLAPNLFRTRMFSFGSVPGIESGSEQDQLVTKINEVFRHPDEASRIGPLAEIISEVDGKLKKLEDQRGVLLYLRNMVLREATRVTSGLGKADRRNILRQLMKAQQGNVPDISSILGLRREMVVEILEQVEKEFAYSV
jgi:predicted transcriptional regulator